MSRAECLYTVTGSRNHVLEAIPGATVWVYQDGTSTPITQTLWSAEVGGIAQSNPLTSDANGTILFWLDAPQVLTLSKSAPGWQTSVETIFVAGGGGAPTGAAGGDLTGTFPNPTLRLGSATGGVLGTDVATLVSGKLSPAAQIQEVIGLADLTDVSGTFAAGVGLSRNATGFKASGKVFSASAYGVVGDGLNASAVANGTALDACIADAHTAGVGSIVALDWNGVAYLSGGHTVYTQLWYRMSGLGTTAKLANSAPAGTHLFQTNNFATLTQTQFASGSGEYEFWFTGGVLDGNKANNVSGGHCLAIAGYGYWLDGTLFQNAKSSGLWCEYNSSNEPIIGPVGSAHQRACYIGRLLFVSNDCATVAAVNGRAGRAAVGGAQMCYFGPGDSHADYIEAYRDGSVAGTGLLVGGLDFATGGSSSGFSFAIDNYTCWLNHNIGLDIQTSDCSIGYLHAEGANINVRSAGQQPRIARGKVFTGQAGCTCLSITGGGNFGYINLEFPSISAGGGTAVNVAASTCTDAEFHLIIEHPHNVAATLTAGSLPTGAKVINISGNNYGGNVLTGGWVAAVPSGQTVNYRLYWTAAGHQIMNAATIWSGSGAPAVALGINGDFYFRTDTPGTVNQRLYVKSAGAWVGII